jgi:hypothetical protein
MPDNHFRAFKAISPQGGEEARVQQCLQERYTVDQIAQIVTFANENVLRNFKLRLTMDDDDDTVEGEA